MSWRRFDGSLERRWDEFAAAHPAGRMVHLSGFKKAVEDTYHFEPFYRAYVGDGVLKAVFPGFFHKSRIYGRKVVSQPFSEYGGILISADIKAEEKEEIVDEFCRMAETALRTKKFDHLEMRNPTGLSGTVSPRLQTRRLFKYAVRRLEDPETMWKALDAKDRNIIQKARSYGLTITEERGEESLRRRFYPLYLKTMKRLGTPPHPLSYFLRLARYLRDEMKVFLVYYRRLPVAALIGWAVGKTVHITDMCSDAAAFFLKPNDFAVWEFLCWATERGYRIFDFGPVRYRGQEIFKKKWRMEFLDYSYAYLSLNPGRIRNPVSDSGGIMAAAPEIWKAAMPVGLGRLIGRCARKEIGL
ncbi:MAG: GNAT family N-acetyltransferase [Candidatus Aminicenantales bacterium]